MSTVVVRWLVAAGLASAGVLVAQPDAAHAGEVPLDLRTTWSCAPAQVFIDPSAPDDVLHAVAQWHRAFRPDWTFTEDQAEAEVVVLMRRPGRADAGGLATIWATATTRVRALVELDPSPKLDQGNLARHELGHVAGLEHNDSSSWKHAMSPYPQLRRYSALELVWMAAAANRCQP